MIDHIKKFIINNNHLFGSKSLKTVNLLQLSSSHWRSFDAGRIIHLVFIDGKPKIVAKFYRGNKFDNYLNHEFKILKSLYNLNPNLYPQPITLAKTNHCNVLFETFVEGNSFFSQISNITYLPSISQNQLSEIFQNHFKMAYTLFNIQNKHNKKGPKEEEIKEIKNLIAEYELLSNTEKPLIKKIENLLLSDNIRTSFKRIVHFDIAPTNILQFKDSYKLIDFEFSRLSYLWYVEPAIFIFHYFGHLIDLYFVKNSLTEAMCSFRSNPKNIFEKQATAFCNKSFNNNPKLMQKAFILAMLKSYILQKKVRAFIEDMEEKTFVHIIEFWLKEKIFLAQNISVKISTKLEDAEEKDIKRLKERIAQLRSQMSSITSSRGWKIISFIHNIRIKFPILKSL